VYDASSRSANGPSLNQLIFDLLVHNKSLTADLEKAFLMVSVDEADRDVLWFLWVDDVSKLTRVEDLPIHSSRVWRLKPVPP